MHVVVVGCGVIGLTTATLLQSRGYRTTIVAKAIPDGKDWDNDRYFTSREAGAHWCSFATEHDITLQEYEATTFRTFWSLSELPEAGLMRIKSNCLFKSSAEEVKLPWYASVVPEFHHIPDEELPEGIKIGFQYYTVTINVVKYLPWLLDRFRSMGGKVVVRGLSHIEEAFTISDNVDVVFNCTGFGARFLGGVQDLDVFPVRGQTILCKVPHWDTITRMADTKDGIDAAYIIPRDDGTVLLGGTFEVYNSQLEPHPEVAKAILERCQQLSPALRNAGSMEIIRHGVGLRPVRCNGIRLESERRQLKDGRSALVVHNYGHGSYGYQSSWGSCSAAVELMERELPNPKSKL